MWEGWKRQSSGICAPWTRTAYQLMLNFMPPVQAGCSQFLFRQGTTQGSVNVVLGPRAATGVATTISHRCVRVGVLQVAHSKRTCKHHIQSMLAKLVQQIVARACVRALQGGVQACMHLCGCGCVS